MTEPPYRAPAPKPPDPYMVAWAALRTRRVLRRIVVGAAGYLVATLLAFALAVGPSDPYSSRRVIEVALMAGGIGLLVLGLVSVLAGHLSDFACPRCGQPFFRGAWAEIGFTRHCWGCGLAVGTPMFPDSEEVEEEGRDHPPVP